MTERIRIDEAREHALRIEAPVGAEEIALTLDGQTITARVLASTPGRHVVEIEGRRHVLRTATDAEGVVWVGVEGRTWRVRRLSEARRKRGPIVGAGAVTPRTPGVVARVLVEVGQEVEIGQELIVVSAMKMETPLVAAHAGTVCAIHAEAGAKVKPGDVLVEVLANDDPS
jgi:acetyl/propionyl-CoA carboxylase alpha subunit